MAASSTESYNDEQTQRQQKVVYTQDELRVIKECRVESFYYRCIPLSTLCSGLAYIGMKHGYLKKSTFAFGGGYVPKMALGVFLGYIFGKMSYYNVCAEKLMRLENSPLANHIRQRYGHIKESLHEDPEYPAKRTPEYYSQSNDDIPILEDRSPDISEHVEGPDSYSRVTESLSPYTLVDDSDIKSSKPYVSYDDIRRAHREEHYNKMTEKYKKSSQGQRASQSTDATYSSHDNQQPHDLRLNSPPPYFDSKKNKYGDVWDD